MYVHGFNMGRAYALAGKPLSSLPPVTDQYTEGLHAGWNSVSAH